MALTGGLGSDSYSFRDIRNTNATILDFTVGPGGGRIDLDALLDRASQENNDYRGGNPFGPDIRYVRLVQSGAGTLLQFDADGAAGNRSDFQTMLTLKGVDADTLNGAAGADSLAGGGGDDDYVVDAAGDKVVEALDAGTDSVDTSVTNHTLAVNVENLRYTGAAAFTGTGNALDNTIQAGAGNDVLNGAAGSDVLTGGAGSDRLTGGAGADIFVLNSLAGTDSITDFVSGSDHLALNLAALGVGNGDLSLDGADTRDAPGGVAREAELVLFSQRAAGAAKAATVIGSASGAYAVGETALFAVSTSTATTLYLFKSGDDDALVSAAELTQVAVLTGTPSTALADYLM